MFANELLQFGRIVQEFAVDALADPVRISVVVRTPMSAVMRVYSVPRAGRRRSPSPSGDEIVDAVHQSGAGFLNPGFEAFQ